MKKSKKVSFLIHLGLFSAVASTVIGAGYYKNAVAGERASFKVDLPAEKSNPVVLDLYEQGIPKRLIQPGTVTLSASKGGGITNKSDQPIDVKVVVEGFPGEVKIDSSSPDFDPKTTQFKHALEPNQSFPLQLDVEIPSEYRRQNQVFTGSIQFMDQTTGTYLATVPVHVINTRIPGPIKDVSQIIHSPSSDHSKHNMNSNQTSHSSGH